MKICLDDVREYYRGWFVRPFYSDYKERACEASRSTACLKGLLIPYYTLTFSKHDSITMTFDRSAIFFASQRSLLSIGHRIPIKGRKLYEHTAQSSHFRAANLLSWQNHFGLRRRLWRQSLSFVKSLGWILLLNIRGDVFAHSKITIARVNGGCSACSDAPLSQLTMIVFARWFWIRFPIATRCRPKSNRWNRNWHLRDVEVDDPIILNTLKTYIGKVRIIIPNQQLRPNRRDIWKASKCLRLAAGLLLMRPRCCSDSDANKCNYAAKPGNHRCIYSFNESSFGHCFQTLIQPICF